MSTPATPAVGGDGALSALLAFYAASAEVMNAAYGRIVLPLLGRA